MELQSGGLSTAKYEHEGRALLLAEIKSIMLYSSFFFLGCCISPLFFLCAVEQAAGIASVSLRPLEGMDAIDVAAATSAARDGVALGALLKLCNGWQKPGAVLQGQCVLVSQTKFEVDVGYHVDVIAAFKQMPTKNYGNSQIMQLNILFCHVCSLQRLIKDFLCVCLADMKTRKWSFSLEDYKRLSEY